MPNVRLENKRANVGIRGITPNIRNTRATTSQTAMGGNIVIGNPIGLLLALTYAAAHSSTITQTNSSDYRPNVMIR